MAKYSTVIKQLLPFLQTHLVKQAEHQLIELCKNERGLRYLIALVYDESLTVMERMSAASHLNRMFIQYSQCFKDDTIEEGLTMIFGDLTVPYKVKSMLVGYASTRLRQDSQQMYFIKILLGIVEDILTQMDQLLQSKGSENINKADETWLTISDTTQIINGCYTVILIGHVVFTLVSNPKIDQSVTKYIKYILKFVRYCGKLHLCIFFADNIIKYPDIFLKLFQLYQLLTMQGANEEMSHACFKVMTEWPHLADDLKLAYLANDKEELQTCDRGYIISQSKLALIAFHWDIFYYLNETQQSQKVHSFLDDFLPTIKQTILKMNSSLDLGDQINYAANMLYILQFSYEMEQEIDLSCMIADFQSLILPIILQEIALYKIQLFESSPSKMYEKLCQVIEYPEQSQEILNPVTAITKGFIQISEDFYLYLFQTFRYSMETFLKSQSIDEWSPPQYLLNKKPMDLSVVFYIMSIMPYSNTFSQEIINYLKSIITYSFVDKLDQLQLAMFYFFLENTWFQLYDEQLNEAKFLLSFTFKTKVNPSAKYFIYQFINAFSDYAIDDEFILEYARKLPILHQCKSKWKNMFNWLTYIANGFEQPFALELVHIIQGHLQDSRQKNLEQVKYYVRMLKQIGNKWQQLEDYDKLQATLLSEYVSLKDNEKKEVSMSNEDKEQLQGQMQGDQEDSDEEVWTKRKQSIYESFTKRVKKGQDMQQITQSQKEPQNPLRQRLSKSQMAKKVSEISVKVSEMSLQ